MPSGKDSGGLRYHEGDDLLLEYRFADGNRDLPPAPALELLRLEPAVIVTFGTPATMAARDAPPTVPIVFVGVGDPSGRDSQSASPTRQAS
jgi:putative ABC transport system substrate-binding protein